MIKEKEISITKQAVIKEQIIEQLKKAPIIQVACQKAQISRASFYRWKRADTEFLSDVAKAMHEGRKLINDYAESQVIKAIQDGNMTAAFYWLNHNHKNYRSRVEVTGRIKSNGSLTPEQQERIMRALEMASLVKNNHLNIGVSEKNKNAEQKNGL